MTDVTIELPQDFAPVEPSVADRVAAARRILVSPRPKEASSLIALGAAALAACTALVLAGAVIMGPGVDSGPSVSPYAAHAGAR